MNSKTNNNTIEHIEYSDIPMPDDIIIENNSNLEKDIWISLPWQWLWFICYRILWKVDDIFFKNTDLQKLKNDLNAIKLLIIQNLIFLTWDEYKIILNKIIEIENFNKEEIQRIDNNFTYLYEGFYLLKELEEIFNNKDIKLDLKIIQEAYRKWMELEPYRKNIIWLLYDATKLGISIKE